MAFVGPGGERMPLETALYSTRHYEHLPIPPILFQNSTSFKDFQDDEKRQWIKKFLGPS